MIQKYAFVPVCNRVSRRVASNTKRANKNLSKSILSLKEKAKLFNHSACTILASSTTVRGRLCWFVVFRSDSSVGFKPRLEGGRFFLDKFPVLRLFSGWFAYKLCRIIHWRRQINLHTSHSVASAAIVSWKEAPRYSQRVATLFGCGKAVGFSRRC